jgi:mono/diheme cytochrome c family protein
VRIILSSLAAAFVVTLIDAIIFVVSGFYDVSVTNPHWRITLWIMEQARARSIRAHAAAITVPSNLGNPAGSKQASSILPAHCAVCHGASGVPRGELARGLYPQPPDLARAAQLYSPGELFWILKHGIKMTGMPAWSAHGDAELWATVAFVEKLPGMTEQEYARLDCPRTCVSCFVCGECRRRRGRGRAPKRNSASPLRRGFSGMAEFRSQTTSSDFRSTAPHPDVRLPPS